jgi:hypothetical protein
MKINKDMLKFLVQEQVNEQFPGGGYTPGSKSQDDQADGDDQAVLSEIRDVLKEVRDMMQTLVNKSNAAAVRPEMMK